MRKPVLLLLLLIAMAAPAEARWYQVEIIVFARNARDAGATEYWPDDPGTPSVTDAQRLANAGGNAAYSRLPRSELALEGSYGGLVASRGEYEPLLHLAWRQPVSNDSRAVPVYLSTDPASSASPRLEGTLKLSAGRYLHAELDLVLSRLEPEQASSGAADENSPYRGPAYRSYRMQQHRRMRSGELHYIDHPLMGVLLLVRPYAPPGAAEEAEPDREGQDESAPPARD
jgi:hypothetical protein